MATAIIGDVHGCLNELGSLVKKIKTRNLEEIIFVGDLMDKGPDTVGVLEYVRELEKEIKVTVVKGNHEYRHFRFWNHMENGYTDKAMSMREPDELLSMMKSIDRDLRCWLLKKTIPYVVRPEINAVVVHGGLTKKITELPEDHRKLQGKNKKRVERNLFIRFVNDDGDMIRLGENNPGDIFWADVYDGRFGHIFFGHQAWLQGEPKHFGHATGIDLGCVYGGDLCAAIVEENKVEFVTVHADKNHWKESAEITPS